ncbi:acid phosphatase [Terriglobus albidus]|uniref:Acid phosphatase n=1 Tax=Terriglobus albidus TaxID=1592106 RepID=A0A5B9EB41_9BACT|nr:metallophosphoesterase [Terriglobus albidus]QEE28904.1 acid phosphatase [Terriglobus albidus]
MNRPGEWSRRRFLLQTAKFSALAYFGSSQARSSVIEASSPDPQAHHVLMLGDWGTVSDLDQQIAVALAMKQWCSDYGIKPDALLMLGDNFYGEMPGGVNSDRWLKQFEQMYPSSSFPGPVYPVLGNHDYERLRGNKVETQLAYTQRSSRWSMPHRWYTVQVPKQNPLLTIFCLDSNLPGSKGLDPWPWSFVMTKEEHEQQNKWLEEQLNSPRSTPFLAVAAHHPLYSNGIHRDNRALIEEWDLLLRHHQVDLYLSGHDHDLQHLEFHGHPTSFVVSGGGGARLAGWNTQPTPRGWGHRVLGFTDLELSHERLTIRHIAKNAATLYEFSKNRADAPHT